MEKLLNLAHSWYPNACCAETHCHEVPCDTITKVDKGYQYLQYFFSQAQHAFSPDGLCHVCLTSTDPVNTLCIFTPIPGIT